MAEVRTVIADGRSLAEAEQDRLGQIVRNADRIRQDLKAAAAVLENAPTAKAGAKQPEAAKPVKKQRENSLDRVRRINRAQPHRSAS